MASSKKQPPPPMKRVDGSGHYPPDYRARLLAETGHGRDADEEVAFLAKARSGDALAEALGEDFVEAATSGEADAEEVFNQGVPEDAGGPFVETSGSTEFAHGTDASNIKEATREPFPTTRDEKDPD